MLRNTSLKVKLLVPLFLMVVLILTIYVSTIYIVGKQKDDAVVINLAGRQRMLTQKMTKELLEYLNTKDEKALNNMKNSQRVFDVTLNALTYGGQAPLDLAFQKMTTLPPAPAEVKGQLERVNSLWKVFKNNLDKAVRGDKAALDYVRKNNVPLLAEMNKAVLLFQNFAEKKVTFMKTLQLVFFIIGLIIAIISFVIYSRTIINPTIQMLNYTEKIAEGGGDLTSRVPVVTEDELGRLASAFNRFMEVLRKLIWAIESMFAKSMSASFATLRKLSYFMGDISQARNMLSENTGAIDQITEAVQNQYAGLEEITSSTQTLAHLVGDLNEEIKNASEMASKGESALNTTINTVEGLRREVSQISERARALADKASIIHEVVQTITTIAEQTNLLALNAAIEAARAGEAGRGFAVVAEEVRKLAEESKNAATQIGENLGALMEGVEQTSNDIASMSEQMQAMSEQSKEVLSSINGILEAIESIKGFSQNVTDNADILSKSTQELANAAERVTELAANINESIKTVDSMLEGINTVGTTLLEEVDQTVKTQEKMLPTFSKFKVAQEREYIVMLKDMLEAQKEWITEVEEFLRSDAKRLYAETDPSRCSFGVIISMETPPSGYEQLWERIVKLHERLHKLGKEVEEYKNAGNISAAEEAFKEIKAISSQLTEAANELMRALESKGNVTRQITPL